MSADHYWMDEDYEGYPPDKTSREEAVQDKTCEEASCSALAFMTGYWLSKKGFAMAVTYCWGHHLSAVAASNYVPDFNDPF